MIRTNCVISTYRPPIVTFVMASFKPSIDRGDDCSAHAPNPPHSAMLTPLIMGVRAAEGRDVIRVGEKHRSQTRQGAGSGHDEE